MHAGRRPLSLSPLHALVAVSSSLLVCCSMALSSPAGQLSTPFLPALFVLATSPKLSLAATPQLSFRRSTASPSMRLFMAFPSVGFPSVSHSLLTPLFVRPPPA